MGEAKPVQTGGAGHLRDPRPELHLDPETKTLLRADWLSGLETGVGQSVGTRPPGRKQKPVPAGLRGKQENWGCSGPSLCSATLTWSHSRAGHPWRHCPSASPEPHPEALPWVESRARPARPPDVPSITPTPSSTPLGFCAPLSAPPYSPPTSRTLRWHQASMLWLPVGRCTPAARTASSQRNPSCFLLPQSPPIQATLAHSGSAGPKRAVPLPVLLIHRPRSWVPSARSLGDPQDKVQVLQPDPHRLLPPTSLFLPMEAG
ncbi:uncharacterized protein LOC106698910 [Myotis lucifugus]|uniref:uncharacterized protein LOC106698910 n=1 Tax=Myotis lucifugus TaxID=59463 RepID=UPI0006D731A9|nr:uncharacterized protein LOC106698910 [Myotis lucifugus]